MKLSIRTVSIWVILLLMMVAPLVFLDTGDGFMKGLGSGDSDSAEQLKAKAPKDVKTVVTDEKVEIYKWHDRYGVPQFAEKPPADGSEVEIMVLSPSTNVIDAIKIPGEEDKAEQKPNVISLGSPYSPQGMKDIVNDSLQLKEQASEQQAGQEKMIEELLQQK